MSWSMWLGTFGLVVFGASLLAEFVADTRDYVQRGFVARRPGRFMLPGFFALLFFHVLGLLVL